MTRIRVALMALVLVLVTSPSFAQGSETVVYFHADAIGSTRLVTDANGQVIERYDYLPFGEPYPPSAAVETRRFGGKERDNETGLDYFGARYYASQNGRFTSTDPFLALEQALVNPQLWNRYTYTLNNPLKFTDPDGKNPVLVVGGIIWGLYEIGSSIYDAYTTYQTVRDPNASTTEKLTTGGLFVAGMLPGVPGGAATAERAAIRHADEIVEAAATVARTPTDRLIQHLSRADLVGAAREMVTGIQHGGQHLKEVREASRGLRERIKDINQGLSNPRLTRKRRLELERELGIASRHLDAAEQALLGRYLQHDIP